MITGPVRNGCANLGLRDYINIEVEKCNCYAISVVKKLSHILSPELDAKNIHSWLSLMEDEYINLLMIFCTKLDTLFAVKQHKDQTERTVTAWIILIGRGTSLYAVSLNSQNLFLLKRRL